MCIFNLAWGITAIAPDIHNDVHVFNNYIGFIIGNVILQEIESYKQKDRIDCLQEQINNLKEQLRNNEK